MDHCKNLIAFAVVITLSGFLSPSKKMVYVVTVPLFLGLTKRPNASKNKNIKIPENVIEEYFRKTGIRIDPDEFMNREEKQGWIF